MVELGWLTLDVMQEHLENLISQGYMTAEELATYLMPLGPTFLSQVGGGIRRGMHSILRARIWCAIALISVLLAAVL
jgi:hypothetical protein